MESFPPSHLSIRLSWRYGTSPVVGAAGLGLVKGRDTGQLFAFEQFEAGTAAG